MNYKQERHTKLSIRNNGIAKAVALSSNNKPESEDTINRKMINNTIIELLLKGKSREEIINDLNIIFSDSKYEKYRQFFESWVNDRLGKKQVNHDDEER